MRNRVLRAAAALAGGLLCAALPSAASATNFSVTTTYAGIDGSVGSINGTVSFAGGPVGGENAAIGRIRLIGTDQDNAHVDMPVYCIDVKDWLGNGTFAQTTLSSLTFSAVQLSNVTKFLVYADPQVNNQVTSAAAQLGVWEILNETTASWNLTGGDFNVQSLWGSNILDAATLANSWLGAFQSAVSHVGPHQLNVLDPGHGNQTQAFITAGGDNTILAVPEPTTWAMVVMGFGALGAALRRRKQDNPLFA